MLRAAEATRAIAHAPLGPSTPTSRARAQDAPARARRRLRWRTGARRARAEAGPRTNGEVTCAREQAEARTEAAADPQANFGVGVVFAQNDCKRAVRFLPRVQIEAQRRRLVHCCAAGPGEDVSRTHMHHECVREWHCTRAHENGGWTAGLIVRCVLSHRITRRTQLVRRARTKLLPLADRPEVLGVLAHRDAQAHAHVLGRGEVREVETCPPAQQRYDGSMLVAVMQKKCKKEGIRRASACWREWLRCGAGKQLEPTRKAGTNMPDR
eukprot:2105879-Pleurochrysis_carterae.AAC.2